MTFYGIKYTTNLIAGQDIEANSIFIILFRTVLIIFIILFLIRIFNRMNNKKRKRKKKKRTNANKSVSPYRFKY